MTEAAKLIMKLEALGLTQLDIAAKTGLSQSTLSEIRSGHIKSPSYDTWRALDKLHARQRRLKRKTKAAA